MLVAAANERLVAIDGALTALRGAARATAGDVTTAATTLRDAATRSVETARSLRAAVDDLRLRIADVHGRVDGILWLGAGALLVIVGYVALLNLLIVWLARRRPDDATAIASDPATPEATPGP